MISNQLAISKTQKGFSYQTNQVSKTMNQFLYVGLVFYSRWFECSVEVLELQKDQNNLKVRITRSPEHYHEEDWNWADTLAGFDRGDYAKIKPIWWG